MRTAPEEVDVPDEPGSVFTRDLSPASFKKALVFLLLLGLITRIGRDGYACASARLAHSIAQATKNVK